MTPLHSPAPPSPATPRRRGRTAIALAATLGLLLAAAGCGQSAGGQTAGAPRSGTVSVLASFYPLQFLAEKVGGQHVTVTNLTPPGAEPHDLELSPAQVQQMSKADLVIYEHGFQPAVDDAVAQSKPTRTVDAATLTELQTPAEEHSEAEGDPGAEDHEHGSLDPHFWLDPSRLPAVADGIAEQLATADPSHAADYRANARTLDADLRDLDGRFQRGLTGCQLSTFVTSHEAFGYLAERYHLTEFSFSGLDPEGEPSPARMQEVADLARAEHLTTLFVEPSVSPRAAASLAHDLGIKVETLDPLETQIDPKRDYLAVMDTNLTKLAASLGCPA